MRSCLILISCVASLALSGCTGGVFIPRGEVPGSTVEMARSSDIRISGVIAQGTADRVLDELKTLPGPVVTVHLDSPGGDVSAALQINDSLKGSDSLVVTSVADGKN